MISAEYADCKHQWTDSKILVVEDDPQMCASMRDLLHLHGFDVRTSQNLLDALNALLNIEYDLILLDLKLNDQCGFSVMDHLEERNLDTQVIVVTGHHSENNAITALKKGATDFLKKPFEPDDLLESVRKVLGRLKQKREQCLFKKIVASSSTAISVGDVSGRLVYTNAAYRRLLNPVSGATPSADAICDIDEQIRNVLESGNPWEGRVDMVDTTGRSFVAWKRVDRVPDAMGGATYGMALMYDMTAQIENERVVASSRERYRRVIDSHKDFLYRVDTQYSVTFVNKAYADCWRKTPRSMIGRPITTWVQDSVQPVLVNTFEAVRSGSTPIEIEYRSVDSLGRTRWQQWHFYGIRDADGTVTEIQCVGRDVTQTKRNEKESQFDKEKFRNLAEITSDWIWEMDKNGVYTYASPVVYEVLGYRPEEVVGKETFDFMPEQEAGRLKGLFEQALTSGVALRNIENSNIHKNGSIITLETSGVPIFDDAGSVVGYRGIDRDISARKRAEVRLQQESDKLKQALAKVKRLSGMLPICASCKMIRDDKGYWSDIEAYIQTHSDAEFSHGICPQCAQKLYPEFYKED
ncbi:MAG: PAS domain S-box protein [Desulfosarcina sp.]